METEKSMINVEGEVISSFELGVIIDDVDFRHFLLRNVEDKICVVVTPECPDFQMCIDELFYKPYKNKYAMVTGTHKKMKGTQCTYGMIADSVTLKTHDTI